MKVFISSVVRGMEPFREAAEKGARSLGHQVLRSENLGVLAESSQQACLRDVRQAEAVILLFGASYGAQQASGLSATHEEYREARERCPVLVFVQQDVEREAALDEFLQEVRAWESGHVTGRYREEEELRESVIRALHTLELARAAGTVDQEEMLARAKSLVPEDHRVMGASLYLTIVGGPHQAVLRPSKLEERNFQRELMREAQYGEPAILDTAQGLAAKVIDDVLVLEQEWSMLCLHQDGSLSLLQPAMPLDQGRGFGLPALIEEDIQQRVVDGLKFCGQTLDRIDPVLRITDVAITLSILGGSTFGWRTQKEHQASPNSMEIGMGRSNHTTVNLSPPCKKRQALAHEVEEIAEDLIVLLRRRMKR